MERSTDAIGGSLEGTSSFFGDLNTNDMQQLDTGDLDNHDGSTGTVCDEDADTPWQLVSTNLLSGQLLEEVSYAPSIRTDFSGFLPEFSADDDLGIAEGYNPEAVVQAAWKSLTAETPKLLWECNFWDRFLDPNVSAMDMLEKGLKRPLPAPIWQDSTAHPLQRLTEEFFQNRFKKSKVFFNMSGTFQNVVEEKNEKLSGKLQLDDG